MLSAQAQVNELRAQLFNQGGQGSSMQTPYFGTQPGSAGSNFGATSASAGQSVVIHALPGHTKTLCIPLYNKDVKPFSRFLLSEAADGRNVQLRALSTPAAITQISARVRLLSESRGFSPEYPEGARGAEEEAVLDRLTDTDALLDWPVQVLADNLVRAYPPEVSGAAALGRSLEEICREIHLRVDLSNFLPLTKYLGEVEEAKGEAAPRVPGVEVQCVKNLHAAFLGKEPSQSSTTFKLELDTRFAGKLPTTIAKYTLAVDREYQKAAAATALAKQYLGHIIGKKHERDDVRSRWRSRWRWRWRYH
jgi:hypothetical protein